MKRALDDAIFITNEAEELKDVALAAKEEGVVQAESLSTALIEEQDRS